jgi:hypothetical protein
LSCTHNDRRWTQAALSTNGTLRGCPYAGGPLLNGTAALGQALKNVQLIARSLPMRDLEWRPATVLKPGTSGIIEPDAGLF